MRRASRVLVYSLLLISHILSASSRNIIRQLSEPQPDQQHNDDAACAGLLVQRLPKVALLFLVLDDIPHEQTWARWLAGLKGALPAKLMCDEAGARCLEQQGGSLDDEAEYWQHWFSIYVHTRPDFQGYPADSLFHGRVIPHLVKTAWGHHSLATAFKLLVTEAVQDPLNQRFQLLCPATIPIRPPLFTHEQLIAEEASRIGTFSQLETDPMEDFTWRYPLAMFEEWPELRHHTKYHRQFVTLNRKHAQLVADDSFVHDLFTRHCFMAAESNGHYCIADEQYVGALLSFRAENITAETTDMLAMAYGSMGGGFEPEAVTTQLIMEMRGSRLNMSAPYRKNWTPEGLCQAVERLATGIWKLNHNGNERVCADLAEDASVTRYPNCHMFARKFQEGTVREVARLLERLRIV